MREIGFRQVGGLLLPDSYPERVGLGCPKCDDHELVPVSQANQPSEAIQRFLKRHAACGPLDQLEVRGGELGVTGTMDPKGAS